MNHDQVPEKMEQDETLEQHHLLPDTTPLRLELDELRETIENKASFHKVLEEKKQVKRTRKRRKRLFIGFLLCVSMVSLLTIFYVLTKLNRDDISTSSMSGHLNLGDKVLVNPDLAIRRFNIVQVEKNGKRDYLRVIGTPGDKVNMADDILFINNAEFDEPYLKENFLDFKYELDNPETLFTKNFDLRNIEGTTEDIEVVPSLKYLLLADNRQEGDDSRKLGLYDRSEIKGVVLIKYWPLSQLGAVQ